MYQGESFEIEFEEVDENPRDFNDANEIIICVLVNKIEKKVFTLSDDEVEVDGTNSALVRVKDGGLSPDDTKLFPTGQMLVEMKAEFDNETFITSFIEPVLKSYTTAL